MKKLSRLLALMLALCLALPVFALAEVTEGAEAAVEDPVLFTFDEKEVTLSQVENILFNLMSNGYLSDYDYETAIEYLIQNMLAEKQIEKLGLKQFTEEEMDAFRAEAQATWDSAVESNLSYFLSEDTEEGRQQARETLEQYYYSMGINLDVLVEDMVMQAAFEKLYDVILEGKDIAVSEEEVRAAFADYVAQDQQMFEGNVSMYEMYSSYYGYVSMYMPEGFRGVTHILLDVDEELMNAYTAAQAALEEESEEGATVTQADVDAALAAILESRKDDIDAIYNWLENGETFENLIGIYGTDPGMENEVYLKEGYAVHKDSITYDPVFTAAAFSEKMQKPGDISDPVVSSFGIHILYYLRDIPSGAVELTDEIYAEIENYLVSTKTNTVYSEAMAAWRAEAQIVYNDEAIADAVNAMNEAAE
ncbi:MAG: peptidylprolyl isomerase [Clostridia bacterium]|nr:peptidylprolyl isomerase [Clostridia bacterium]